MKIKNVINLLDKLDPETEFIMDDIIYIIEKEERFEHILFSMSVGVDGNEEILTKALNDAKLPLFSKIDSEGGAYPYLIWDGTDWDGSKIPTENLVDIEEFLKTVSDSLN